MLVLGYDNRQTSYEDKVKASIFKHVHFNYALGSCNANMDEIYTL